MSINVVDLFCGCGGLSYGFVMAGYDVLFGLDNDAMALQTFQFNHPGSMVLNNDIGKISGKNILSILKVPKIDVLIGGPPCQGFSLSGPRNFDDPRNTLYLSFIRLVSELKPKIILIENVPGIIGLYNGQIRDEILIRFQKIGYNIKYKKLNAADYGIPQLRNRVFFIGIFNESKPFRFPSGKNDSSSYITAEEDISDLPSLENSIGTDPCSYPEVGYISEYQKYCRKESKHIHNHIGTNHTEKTRNIISLVPEGGNYKNLPEKYRKIRNFHVAFTRLHSKKPAPTVDTGHRHHFHYKHNRVPTVRENARLQSFPDTFIFIGNKSQQYKQVGNAVPPLLGKILAERIKKYL